MLIKIMRETIQNMYKCSYCHARKMKNDDIKNI